MNNIAYIRDENGVPQPILSLQGLSAYQTWLKQGNTGTEADFLASLKGEPGDIENIEGATVDFIEATSRTNIVSGDVMSIILGKIKKWFTDLKTVAFTGSYNDLADKPSIPSKVSDLTNDSGYQSADQVNAAISNLVNGSPAALDTLQELATALGNDPNFATTVSNLIGTKAKKSVLKSITLATNGWVDDTNSHGYYKYQIEDIEFIDGTIIKITANSDSDLSAMIDAEFSSLPDIFIGRLIVKAKNLPNSDINIKYSITY